MSILPWPPPSPRWEPPLPAPSPFKYPGSYTVVFFHAPLDEVLRAIPPTLEPLKVSSASNNPSQQPHIKQRIEEIEPTETKSSNPDPAPPPVPSQRRPRRPRADKRDEWDRLFHQGRYARAISPSSDELDTERAIPGVRIFNFNDHIDTPNVRQALIRIDIHQVSCAQHDQHWPPFWLACWFFGARTLRLIPTPNMDSVWTYRVPPPTTFSAEMQRRDREGQILEEYKIPPVHRIQRAPESASSSSNGAVVKQRRPNRVVDLGERLSWDLSPWWETPPRGTVHPCMMHRFPSKDCIDLHHSHSWFGNVKMMEDDEQGGGKAQTQGKTQGKVQEERSGQKDLSNIG